MTENRPTYALVLALAWFVGIVYSTIPLFWLMVHPFAERLRRRRFPFLLIVPAWCAMIAAVCVATWRWRFAIFYGAGAPWVPAGLLFAAAIFLYQRAHLNFSHRQVMGRSEVEPGGEQRLVTAGIRQYMRHPIYLGHLCFLLGLTVGSGEIVLYVLTLFAFLTGWPMIRQEEAELERRFGDEYRAYQRAVPARLLPRIFCRSKADRQHEKQERV